MTSRLAVMGARLARVASTQHWGSIMCMTGAESDVYVSVNACLDSIGSIGF